MYFPGSISSGRCVPWEAACPPWWRGRCSSRWWSAQGRSWPSWPPASSPLASSWVWCPGPRHSTSSYQVKCPHFLHPAVMSLIAAIFLAGVFLAGLDTASNSLVVAMLGPVRAPPFTQSLHAMVGLGFVLGSLLVRPFLPDTRWIKQINLSNCFCNTTLSFLYQGRWEQQSSLWWIKPKKRDNHKKYEFRHCGGGLPSKWLSTCDGHWWPKSGYSQPHLPIHYHHEHLHNQCCCLPQLK